MYNMLYSSLQNMSNFLCKRLLLARLRMPRVQPSAFASKSAKDHPAIPKNVIADRHSASSQTEKGKIYDKKPFKMPCETGKKYAWCACGQSKSQPLCDGTHKNVHLRIKMRPVFFQVEETKEYWLCNCKQTSNRPFCDGTHKREDIQAAIKT